MQITAKQMFSTVQVPAYTLERIIELWAGRESISLLDITNLEIPVNDIIWAVTQFFDAKTNRLLSADYAESVLHLWTAEYPDDDRPELTIKAARDFANGKISREQLDNAWYLARGAARGAARDATIDRITGDEIAASAAGDAMVSAMVSALSASGAVDVVADWAAMVSGSETEEPIQWAILRQYILKMEAAHA